jgi:hypothetical protein
MRLWRLAGFELGNFKFSAAGGNFAATFFQPLTLRIEAIGSWEELRA